MLDMTGDVGDFNSIIRKFDETIALKADKSALKGIEHYCEDLHQKWQEKQLDIILKRIEVNNLQIKEVKEGNKITFENMKKKVH